VQAAEGAAVGVRQLLVVEQDGGGDQRPGQATAPGLVGSGDETTLEAAIESEQAAAAGEPAAAGPGPRGCRCGRVASRWQRPHR